ncbi:MAG: ABC transporter permease [Gammaproteobacteria bacterium]|nr:ABC transporter permease [Gammaproteobacteria bacterium]
MVRTGLSLASLRFFLQHPWQLWLTLLSIALGSAVMIAVDLANQSARESFGRSVDAVAGHSTHRILGGRDGIDERFYTRLRIEHRVRDSAPVVEGHFDHRGERYTLIGMDVFAAPMIGATGERFSQSLISELLTRPNTVLLTEATAGRLGIGESMSVTLSLNGSMQTLRIAGFLQDSESLLDNVLLTDIASAQELFAKQGRLDRIELQLEGAEVDSLKRLLPPALRLEASQARSQALDQMTEAFRINLAAMSLLAMLVSAFLVYNTMTFSVLQRRRQFSIERMLGVTGRQLALSIFIEATLLALLGAMLGTFFGVLLGQGLLALITRTISDLYTSIDFTVLSVQPLLLVKGFGLTLLAVWLAAAAPALEAARVPPVTVSRRSETEIQARRIVPWLLAGGVLLSLAGAGLLAWLDRGLLPAFVALFLIVIAYSFFIPSLSGIVLWLIERLSPGSLIAAMAVRGIRASRSRTNLAIVALAVAVSATVGVGIMIDSFRTTVAGWLSLTLQSDLYISTDQGNSSQRAVLDDYWRSAVSGLDGVSSVSTGKHLTVTVEGLPVPLLALDAGIRGARGFRFLDGDADSTWRVFQAGEGVLISEPFAWHHRLQRGDDFTIAHENGQTLPFKVAGVYRDYSASQGMLVMPRSLYRRYWQDDYITTMGLYLDDDADLPGLREKLSALAADATQPVLIRSNAEIREHSMDIFDRTFAITNVLRLLVIIVAFVGVFSALMALFLEKSHEFSVLRASGMTGGQLTGMVLFQTCIIGLIAGLLALPLGWLMSEILIGVINQRSFGWSMDRHFAPQILVQALLLSTVAALIAGIYPTRRIAGISIGRGLREL